jgi:hypothetical protein
MKTPPNRIFIHLKLGTGFMDEVKAEMENELDVASKKWGIRLNMEDRDLVLKHSLNQLKKKVSESAKHNWDFSPKVSIKVTAGNRASDITLPDPASAKSKMKIIKSRDGWEIPVEQEHSDEAVLIGEFHEHFKSRIKTWARTAVFYGVSSFAQ